MAEIVLVDTSAWIAFFRSTDPVASLVDDVLRDASAAHCGVVELELRQGLRPEERDDVLALIGATRRLSTEERDWAAAGDLLASLRRRGMTIPSTDGLIAHLALRHGAALVENDAHFENFPDLDRPRSDVQGR